MIDTIPVEIIGHIGHFLDKATKCTCALAAKSFASIFSSQETYVIEINDRTIDAFISKDFRLVANVVRNRMPNLKYVHFELTMMINTNLHYIVHCFREALPNVKFQATLKCCTYPDAIIDSLPDDTEVHLYHNRPCNNLDLKSMSRKTYGCMMLSSRVMSDSMNDVIVCKQLMDKVRSLKIYWMIPLDLTQINPSTTHVTVEYAAATACELPQKDIYKIKTMVLETYSLQYVVNALKQDMVFKKHTLLEEVILDCRHGDSITHDLCNFLEYIPDTTMITLCRSFNTMCPATLHVTNILISQKRKMRFCVNSDVNYRVATFISLLTKTEFDILLEPPFVPVRKQYTSLKDVWGDMTDSERCQWAHVPFMHEF